MFLREVVADYPRGNFENRLQRFFGMANRVFFQAINQRIVLQFFQCFFRPLLVIIEGA